MKLLYITTIGSTMGFFNQLTKCLIDKGHTIDIATNVNIADVPVFYKNLNCRIYSISCVRTPFSFQNIKAIKQIEDIVKNNHYDIVHCHTPVASFCTRIACRKLRKNGVKVVYTCHGFHFHKKSPIINWLTFYPAERLCARFTDMIITINKEDYNLARTFKTKKVKYIHGVGIDFNKISSMKINIDSFRKQIGVPSNAFLLTSIGELTKRKNFGVVIDSVFKIKDENVFYVICGEGPERDKLLKKINDYHMNNRIILLGAKEHNYALELCHASDVGVISSKIEGLGLAGLEHMASGKPVIGSNVHGIKDYIISDDTGYLCEPNSSNDFAKAIINIKKDEIKYKKLAFNAEQKAKEYDQAISLKEMIDNYMEVLNG